MANNRRKYLLKRKRLSPDEFKELVRLSPQSSFKKSPYLMTDIGVKDMKVAFKNMRQLKKRSERAYINECYLEVLSIRLLVLDLFLRKYIFGTSVKVRKVNIDITVGQLIKLAKKDGLNKEFINLFKKYDSNQSAKDIHIISKPLKKLDSNIQFGTLISDAENIGMDKKLVKKLWKFNDDRIKGLHRLLLGEISYHNLKNICDRHKGLVKEMQDYILMQTFWIPMK